MNDTDTPQDGRAQSAARLRSGLLLAGILCVTINLRGAITGVGPLIGQIQGELGVSSGIAGLLTTLPLFAFATVSPLTPALAGRFGMERTLFSALLLLLGGLVLRVLGAGPALFAGTAIIGVGIAVGNVLVPGLIRRDFPTAITAITAIYTMMLVTAGGLGSGLAVPLAELGGWRISLVAWALPAIVALIVWLPQLSGKTAPLGGTTTLLMSRALWRSPLAWQVTLFMGLQSSAFYVLITWLPSILGAEGISAAMSGWVLFIFQIAILGGTILIPILIHRSRDQSWIGVGCGAFILAGYAGLLANADWVLAWMIVAGIGAGGSLALVLTLFGLRASDPQQTVGLSGMAQSLGYLLAAVMPLALGFLHDAVGTWTPVLIVMIAAAMVQMIVGFLAGRPLTVGARQ